MAKQILTVCIGVIALVGLLWANESGAQPGKTGGPYPDESVCSECHSPTPPLAPGPNRGPGNVDFSVQPYVPGQSQRITVTVSDPNAVRWGFQLSARPASNQRQQAGRFRALDANAQVLCGDDTPAPAGGCGSKAREFDRLEFPTHTLAGTRRGTRNSASFTVEWTAPSSDVGEIIFAAAGNAANGNSLESGDNVYTKQVRVSAGAILDLTPRISAGGVVGAGLSNTPVRNIAANGIISIFGESFYPAGQNRLVSGSDLVDNRLPDRLGGICVEIGGQRARMFHVFPTQLNVQVPSLTATGPVPVEVIVNCGISGSERRSNREMATVQAVAPEFFYFRGTDNRPRVAAINAVTFAPITGAARRGDIVALYATGLGRTNPAFESGVLPPGIASTVESATVTLGGVQLAASDVLYAGVAPGLAGLYQINIRIPDAVADGDLPIVVRIGGVSTPEGAFLTVQR